MSSDDFGLLVMLGGGLMLGGLLVATAQWRIKQFNRLLAVGHMHLRRLQLDAARASFAELAQRFRLPRQLPKLARYNQAIAELRLGHLDAAVALLEKAERARPPRQIANAVPSTLALVHALRGDLVQAERWFQLSRTRPVALTLPGPNVLFESVLALRQGKAAMVATRLEAEWPELEYSRTGETLRPLRLLRAFALQQSAGDPRVSGAIEALVATLRPVRKGELDYFAAAWPEMAAFLDEHQLRG